MDVTHRERVLEALNHEEPVRVPIDIGGMRSTGIHAIAYKKLREHLGLRAGTVKLYDVSQQLSIIDRDILQFFDADMIPITRLAPSFGIKIDRWKEGRLPDGSKALVPEDFNPVREGDYIKIKDDNGRTIAKRSKKALYFDQAGVYHPLVDASTIEDLKEKKEVIKDWCNPIGEEEKNYLATESKKLRETTNYAILAEFGGSIYEKGQSLRGYKQWCLDLAGKKRFASYLLDLLVENYLENLETFINAIGENADVIGFGGDDLGMQTGPQISPAMYRELFKPRHKKMWDFVKRNSDLRVFLHSCGSIYGLLPDIIDAGVDIINPVHIAAKDMEPERLKKEFGDELVFWGGGCDTQDVLPNGSIEEIEKEVKKNISIFSTGGGFVFAPVHNIQPDVSPEKIVKLYKSAKRYGIYKGNSNDEK